MMHVKTRVSAVACAFGLFGSVAWGGLIVTNTSNPDPLSAFGQAVNDAAQTVKIEETWSKMGSVTLNLKWAQADIGKTYSFEKVVKNDTKIDWTGFNMNLIFTGGVEGFTGNPTSTAFNQKIQTANTLNWSDGKVLGNGGMVTFTFKIKLTGSLGTYDLQQSPVPAPSSLALLGVAGCAALSRRRR